LSQATLQASPSALKRHVAGHDMQARGNGKRDFLQRATLSEKVYNFDPPILFKVVEGEK
jgi:hypothetical protein